MRHRIPRNGEESKGERGWPTKKKTKATKTSSCILRKKNSAATRKKGLKRKPKRSWSSPSGPARPALRKLRYRRRNRRPGKKPRPSAPKKRRPKKRKRKP